MRKIHQFKTHTHTHTDTVCGCAENYFTQNELTVIKMCVYTVHSAHYLPVADTPYASASLPTVSMAKSLSEVKNIFFNVAGAAATAAAAVACTFADVVVAIVLSFGGFILILFGHTTDERSTVCHTV